MMILDMDKKKSSLLDELFSIKTFELFAWVFGLESYMYLCKKENAALKLITF